MKSNKVGFSTAVGTARYPWLKEPDTAFGQESYKCMLILDSKEGALLHKQIVELAEENFGSKADKALMPFEKDDETGEFVFKTKSSFQPKFWDSQGNPITTSNLPDIWGGSQLKLAGWIAPWNKNGKMGVTLQLMKVMVVQAQGPNGEGGDSGFDTVEGGFVTEESESFEDSSPDETPSYL
tara:strand:- start:280 stop:822 length:543 start_codon:yes stop_codon:yes gene_type:complete